MKKAIVLGATGSLGKEIIKILLSLNYEVIGSFYSESKLKDPFFKENNIQLRRLDMASKDSINNFLKTIEGINKIDFLTSTISNPLVFNKFENISLDIFLKDLKSNVTNYIYFIQKVLPKMNKNSNIIFILTEMVFDPAPAYFSSYVLSKYALKGLMESLYVELKQKDIRVNGVSPGMMDTSFIQNIPKLIKEKYILDSPSKKLVSPEEVAKKIKEIILNKNINGENIPIFERK